MQDPDEKRNVFGETLTDAAEVGADIAEEGFVEMAIEGAINIVDATGEIVGDALGGVFEVI